MAPRGPDAAGLSSAVAAERLRTVGRNEITENPRRTLWRQIAAIVTEPMLFLVIVAGIAYFMLAEPLDGSILLSTTVVIIGLSLHQERRTAGALAALRNMSDPMTTVVRDGTRGRIPATELVPGDVVAISEGDRITADGELLESVHLEVDESALTGESLPVPKSPAPGPPGTTGRQQDGHDTTVRSGTLVTKGHGSFEVTATGDRTCIGAIGRSLGNIETPRTPLQREVRALVRVIAGIGTATAVIVTVAYSWVRGSVLEGILVGTATAMSLLPVEFLVVMSVFLALGARRLAAVRVLARRPEAVETLGSVTVLCVDKTGTLTMNDMVVSHLWADGSWLPVGYGGQSPGLCGLIDAALLATAPEPADPVDRAFRSLGVHRHDARESHDDGWDLVREYPLTPELMAMSHVWQSPDRDHHVIAAKGAPEAIASLCHLDDDRCASVYAAVAEMTATGHRVLAVARARFGADDELPAIAHGFDFVFLGLAALVDPVRPGVVDAVTRCSRAGVRTVMITGDHAGTASAVAGQIHLGNNRTVLTGPELSVMTDSELVRAVRTVNVFARVTPQQKLRLVTALQADGETVGMTGDGVNDAPALRKADVGIAMGRRGTDVAREAAALVITDDDYTSIVHGIEHGRGVLDNIRKAMCYVIAVHTPIAGMAVIPLFHGNWPLVLLPVQIAFLQLIIDPTSALVFEGEATDPGIMERPPRRTGTPLFDRAVLTLTFTQGLVALLSVSAVYAIGAASHEEADVTRTTTFAAIVFSNLALMLTNRSWELSAWQMIKDGQNPVAGRVVTVAVAALVVLTAVPVCRRAFGFGVPDVTHVLLALCAGVSSVAWFELWKLRRRGK